AICALRAFASACEHLIIAVKSFLRSQARAGPAGYALSIGDLWMDDRTTTGRAGHIPAFRRMPKGAGVDVASWNVDPATPLWRIWPFALLFTARVTSNITNHMIVVAVGYQIYELTDSASMLGLVGLAQYLPPLFLGLFAGQAADRFNRRRVLRCCFVIEFCAVTGFLILSLLPHPSVTPFFLLIIMNATARIFENPAIQALVPFMAPHPVLSRAIAAHVSAAKVSMLIGPSLGGVLYLFGPYVVYSACIATILTAITASAFLPRPPNPAGPPKVTLRTLLGGLSFIWR